MEYSKHYHAKLYHNLGALKNDFRNYNLTSLIASKIKGNSVLDIGCGNGYLLNALSKKGIKTLGIEPNAKLIKLAKIMHPRLKVIKGRAEDMGKIRHKFGAVTMVDVLEHIKDDNLQIKKICRCLNDGGQLVLVVPAFQFLYGKRDKNNGHYRRYSKRNLSEKLKKAGFIISQVRYWNMIGFFPYLFYEKVLREELNTELRIEKKMGLFEKSLNKLLNYWFKHVENNFDFQFGLSLIFIAEKPVLGRQ